MSYKRFLIIAYAFPPNGSVGSCIRIVKFLKYLRQLEKNWQFEVLTVNLGDSYSRKAALSIASDIPKEVIIHRAEIILEPMESTVKNLSAEVPLATKNKTKAFFKKIVRIFAKILYLFSKDWILLPDTRIRWFPAAIAMGKKLIDEKKFDLIFATTPPYTVGLVGQRLARYGKIPLVIDIRDDWTTLPRYFRKPMMARKIIQLLEKKCVSQAKKVILVTPASYRSYLFLYPKYKEKFVLITNGCDLAEFSGVVPTIRNKSGIFKIVHSGPLNKSKNPDAVFEALSYLKKTGRYPIEKIKLYFIGGIQDIESKRKIKILGIEDVVQEIPFLERKRYIQFLLGAHLAIVINAHGATTLIPGKIYEYWASQTPIILIDYTQSAASELVMEKQIGEVCNPGDSNAVAEVICKYAENFFCGERIQNFRDGLPQFDRKNLSKKLKDLLDEVVSY